MLQVIFSDEKKFNLDGPDGFSGYWHDLRKEELIFSRRSFGGGSLMMWGGFSALGKLSLAFPSTKMNSVDYQQVLERNLVPYLSQFPEQKIFFQQDNAPVHVSKSTRAWLGRNNIELLEWPPCSPDLNPIENLWGIIVHRVYAQNREYKCLDELMVAIVDVWNNIEDEIIQALVNSMPERMFRVINTDGNVTGY